MNRSFLLGAAVAAGALLLLPGVAAAAGRAVRPLVRTGLRSGAAAWDDMRKAGAEAWEHAEDVLAEVREEQEAKAAAGAERGSEP